MEELIRQGFERHAIDILDKCPAADQISIGIYLAQRSHENANEIIEIAFNSKNLKLLDELEQAIGMADLKANAQKRLHQLRAGRKE